jgi:RimJ/RimL family protein N-acetyltransferase
MPRVKPGADVEHVRTARLIGRRPAFRDADELHPLMADERVVPWLWPEGPPTPAQVRSLLVRDADHWKRHRWGPWIVRDAATQQLIGRVGLETTTVEDEVAVELAWMVRADRWGEGLATEMAAEAVRVGFDDVGLEAIVSFTLPHNVASRAVMTKLGFTYARDFEHAGLPHVLYVLRRAR